MTETTNVHPEIAEIDWIDDAFYVEETRFMWKSVRKDTGNDFLFGLTKEAVITMTRWHLQCEQDLFLSFDLLNYFLTRPYPYSIGVIYSSR